jgi:hypothetical protein
MTTNELASAVLKILDSRNAANACAVVRSLCEEHANPAEAAPAESTAPADPPTDDAPVVRRRRKK